MIDFELEPQILSRLQMFHAVSEHMMRPISRDCDEHEHTKPTQFYESMWSASATAMTGRSSALLGTHPQ